MNLQEFLQADRSNCTNSPRGSTPPFLYLWCRREQKTLVLARAQFQRLLTAQGAVSKGAPSVNVTSGSPPPRGNARCIHRTLAVTVACFLTGAKHAKVANGFPAGDSGEMIDRRPDASRLLAFQGNYHVSDKIVLGWRTRAEARQLPDQMHCGMRTGP
jgi:hypothetical protein